MFTNASSILTRVAAILLGISSAQASSIPYGFPTDAKGLKTIYSPGGISVRYKEPNICETTPGVRTYSGYIDLDSDTHMFFWFFESRNNPATDPTTLWLTGGPGSDSLLAALIEHGPCSVVETTTPEYNPYSWSNQSNMLYLSQPVGAGFSYSQKAPGSIDPISGDYRPTPITGIWPTIDASKIDTSGLAAVAAWHTIQAFFTNLEHLDPKVKSINFNLWTESYGGHYGPIFWDYFFGQNEAIKNKTQKGFQLNLDTIGIGNGIIDAAIQAPFYPEFAVNNTYGIKLVNDTVYEYMKFALNFPYNGCLAQIEYCRSTGMTLPNEKAICAEAQDQCRDNVEGPYYSFSDRGPYDIRFAPGSPPVAEQVKYLNQGAIQDALGVSLNYTTGNSAVYYAFQQAGDWVLPHAFAALERVLEEGVRVIMYYGDADYICNWFGGEAVSLALNYTHAAQFKKAGYAPFNIDGIEYGAVREYGNFSFLRIYDCGHQVPFYQPMAAQVMFQRAIQHLDLAEGKGPVTGSYSTNGSVKATHTETYHALPTKTPAQ